jgi:hypothetical protein
MRLLEWLCRIWNTHFLGNGGDRWKNLIGKPADLKSGLNLVERALTFVGAFFWYKRVIQ